MTYSERLELLIYQLLKIKKLLWDVMIVLKKFKRKNNKKSLANEV
jgi:hypothetical protein